MRILFKSGYHSKTGTNHACTVNIKNWRSCIVNDLTFIFLGITTLCLHTIHHKLFSTSYLCNLSTCHFLASDEWTRCILGFNGWFSSWNDQVNNNFSFLTCIHESMTFNVKVVYPFNYEVVLHENFLISHIIHSTWYDLWLA